MKRCSTSFSLGKCKENHNEIPPIKKAKIVILILVAIASTGEDVEPLEFPYTADGNAEL